AYTFNTFVLRRRPVFRSGLWVRAAHTVLTWSITLILFLHDTDLRRCEERGELLIPVVFFLLVVLSVLLYFAVSLMDPGFVLEDAAQVLTEETEQMIPDSSVPRVRRCGYCFLLQPMRARHCASCGHCVRRFDHHCPWISNCVGERNHRVFVLYLSVQLLTLLWATHIALSGFSPVASWEHWFKVHVFLLGALSVVGVFSLVVLILLGCHLYLASMNCTTWEFMSRHRVSYLKNMSEEQNPFDRGVLCNLWAFFCVCRAEIWEQVYVKNSTLNSV
uniref:Palmitoyltransferase n=1 Tax=Periophthalmus magnuspinnatus TaxID=409849 RepID=A0A3B4AKL1_9GOBI